MQILTKLFSRASEAGFGFGLTSGIITTLGLIVGLSSGTNSKLAVVGGILTIAVADSFSDALGMHVSQESENAASKSIWQSTISTLLSKLIFALTFLIPVLLLNLEVAVWVSIIWGLSVLGLFSYFLARQRKEHPRKTILEHILVAVIAIIISYLVGKGVALAFK